MRLAPGIALLVVLFVSQLLPMQARAQVVTSGPDSVLVITSEADTTQQKQFFLSGFKNLGRPGRAALFSAIIPGAGQVYNGAWWKVPIIYATGGVLGYFIIDNNNKYQDFRNALNARTDNNSGFYQVYDAYYFDRIYGANVPIGTKNLRSSRDFYRRNRDLTIIISVLAYGMQIAEAYVHGHLREFDVSDNLSLRVQPDVFRTPAANGVTPGLTLTLYTRTK
ncbi:DUF5683 domain-containing protein [Pontibacter sp. BT731]|uniref:DUF5683 domain-containing protein n=1 Tax=Pontibacter coccineus TaxID=3063328 RepID=UPI0026E3E07E|nr:DUF5683 domain-containing protein [Pontibacter sp. BT731]MDO6391186.1 DUF5683 domain-containing protein [Pontibacter sp. BT731]